jgi:mRNA interferase RelE/StbE
MSQKAPYVVVFTPAARRRLARLPLPAAAAMYEHLTGPVAENPHRLGKPLDAPFDEVWATRRGEYRALYTVHEPDRVITVLAVAHRRDAYRPL